MDGVDSGKDRSQEPAFRNAKRGQPWFGPVYFRKETEPYMTIAIRSGGDKGPVTVADVNLKFIWDVVSRIKIGEKGKAYVVDGNGFLVADPDIGLVLRKTDLSSLAAREGRAAAAQAAPTSRRCCRRDLAGTQVLTSVAPIEPLGWKVFVEQPVAEVYAKLNASIVRTGLLLLAGLVSRRSARWRSRAAWCGRSARWTKARSASAKATSTSRSTSAPATSWRRSPTSSTACRRSCASRTRASSARSRSARSELKNSLEQQTAISEILRVISSSPTDVQPVLDAVAERAAHLCDAPLRAGAAGRRRRCCARWPSTRSSSTPLPVPSTDTARKDRRSPAARRSIGRPIHYRRRRCRCSTPNSRTRAKRLLSVGSAAVLAVPLMREGGAYGGILLCRREPRPFSPDQVALVETFARQAAIAIDNVRLFNETKEALEQQTAISEILRVISSSPTDVQPVLRRRRRARAEAVRRRASRRFCWSTATCFGFAARFGSAPTVFRRATACR